MNFLLYGAGALGQALGGLLAAKGHQVDLLLRDRFIGPIKRNGLHICGIFGEISVPSSSFGVITTLTQANKNYNYVLITTKTYNTLEAGENITSLGDRANNIVSLQNGCGNLELLQTIFPKEKVIGGRVITGFEILKPGVIEITVSADAIHVGSATPATLPDNVIELAKIIDGTGHPCTPVSDIYQSLFSKLLYNCTLNPLGALLGVHYGILGDNIETQAIMNSTMEETFKVIQKLGSTIDSLSSYKDLFYNTLLPITYYHRPSMLQDLENNKPTEVDALVGYVSKQGKTLNIPTPTCDMLTALIKFKENN